jgi:hypothetical protein
MGQAAISAREARPPGRKSRVDAGEPLAVQVAHYICAGPCRADSNLGIVKGGVQVDHDAQNIQAKPRPGKRSRSEH